MTVYSLLAMHRIGNFHRIVNHLSLRFAFHVWSAVIHVSESRNDDPEMTGFQHQLFGSLLVYPRL